jgi:uroporphyrinogen-III decarboxylase
LRYTGNSIRREESMLRVPTNEEKKAVWEAYRARRPTRVPLTWGVNARIVLLDPALNPEGYGFEDYTRDPRVLLTVQSRFQEYVATTLSRTADFDSTLPETWNVYLDNQNVYDAAYFGAPVTFEPGQVPSSLPAYTFDTVDEFLARDFSRPLENPWIRERLATHAALVREAEHFTYLGRKAKVAPFGVGFDGPVTALASLFGADGITLLAAEPEKAGAVLLKITRDCMARNRALADLAGGWKKSEWAGLADDSIQMISTAMYRELVLPLHALWYDEMTATRAADRTRFIHLCGDATRHFRTIRDELGVMSFDTGFPVDHGALRRELGPDAEIMGGPRVTLLRDGTPAQCAAETKAILQSGVMAGGRFVLREGNNLPPRCPLGNLTAVYETCLEHGRYATGE